MRTRRMEISRLDRRRVTPLERQIRSIDSADDARPGPANAITSDRAEKRSLRTGPELGAELAEPVPHLAA